MAEPREAGSAALLSDCGRYRYRLEREALPLDLLGGPQRVVVFIGVNPSTADAVADDATVRKWRGFAARWGYTRFVVGNLFAYRATQVAALAAAEDAIGPDCDAHLQTMLREAEIVVPCWGERGKLPPRLRSRIDQVWALIRAAGRPVHALGITTSGDPKHPLMLGYDTPLVPWSKLQGGR